ncbi:MAG: CPBP family intramembrane metalloprotease [Gammaproteobacteria bacterium]|nr:CPBP family intramembrane metalloprotease [Gammaproteobacteria bacterium]
MKTPPISVLLIRRYPVFSFIALACLLSSLLLWPAFPPMAHENWRSAGDWHVLGALGPMLAVVLVLSCLGGRSALLQLFSRLIDWRVAPSRALFCVFSPLVLLGVAVAIAQFSGYENTGMPSMDRAARHWALWLLIALLPTLAYALGEEIGWRGYVLEYLQRRHSCFTATILVAILWAIWHLLFIVMHSSSISSHYMIWLFTSLFAQSIFLTYIYNTSRGSLFLAVIWHILWSLLSLLTAMVASHVAELMNGILLIGASILLHIIDKQAPERVLKY